jgi:hypothetical protein
LPPAFPDFQHGDAIAAAAKLEGAGQADDAAAKNKDGRTHEPFTLSV